jgi:hypothetical protein
MRAILCTYHGPTDSRGSRITASSDTCRVSVPYPHELSGQACYRVAAEALAKKMGWDTPSYGPLLGAWLKADQYVFVFDNTSAKE